LAVLGGELPIYLFQCPADIIQHDGLFLLEAAAAIASAMQGNLGPAAGLAPSTEAHAEARHGTALLSAAGGSS
jgi:hypothetical protein